MPIYEYRCTACQHKLEALQKFSDAQLVVCPQCGRDALTKLVSAAGFHLKGSGWYQTDFKNSGSKPAAQARSRGRRDEDRRDQDDGRDRGRQGRCTRRQSRDCGCAPKQSAGGAVVNLRRRRYRMKRYLVAGLLVWVPLGITLWVLHFLVTTLDQTLLLFPEVARPDALIGFHIPGFGVLLSFGILLLTGVIAANFFGARLIRFWEGVFGRIPVVKSIYSSVKQVSDTLLSDSGNAFRKALLVEFPHENAWTIAFLTGTPAAAVAAHLSEEHVSVYVPTTPNPTSGYFIIVPKSRVRDLDMTVDEALKYVISMGVVAPRGLPEAPPLRQPAGAAPSPALAETAPNSRN